jgi:hypothetical protein
MGGIQITQVTLPPPKNGNNPFNSLKLSGKYTFNFTNPSFAHRVHLSQITYDFHGNIYYFP